MDDDVIELLGMISQDPILGRRVPSRRGGTSRMRAALHKALVPVTPGVPKPGAREFPLGFAPIQFVNAGPQQLDLVALPQRPHKGTRLVLDIAESVAGVGGLITVDSLLVGQANQLQSAEPIIAGAFANDSTYVMLNLDPATPGIRIVVRINITGVLGIGETVDVGGALWGVAIG